MLKIVRMRLIKRAGQTTRYEPLDRPSPMREFYCNTEFLTLLALSTFDTIGLVLSTEKLDDKQVGLALLAIPFFGLTTNLRVNYEHRVVLNGRERMAPNTPVLPVTRAYVSGSALPETFIADRLPIYFGVFPILNSAELIAAAAAAAEEIVREAAIARFDHFLWKSVRVHKGGKLSSWRVWQAWAEHCGADPDDREISGVRFKDIAPRIRKNLEVTAAKSPAFVDGKVRRYWDGYTI